jgi:hypothetical protein
MHGQDGDRGGERAGESVEAIQARAPDAQVRKFEVVPTAIVVGQGVTVAWKVDLAETFDGDIYLNGALAGATGQQTFTPTESTTFILSAVYPDGTEGDSRRATFVSIRSTARKNALTPPSSSSR